MREDLLPTTFDGKLARVMEKCGEVLQAIGKIWRFGYKPTDQVTGITYDNIGKLKSEMNDLQDAMLRVKLTEELMNHEM